MRKNESVRGSMKSGMRQCVLLMAALWISSASLAMPKAFQIEADRVNGLDRHGPDAVAGVGDWWLSNGLLCASVADIDHDAGLVVGGGSLIDLGFCDRADDQWTYANVLSGLAKERAIGVKSIEAQLDKDNKVASIVSVGEGHGLRQTVRYSLSQSDQERLIMEVELERIGEGPAVQMSGVLHLHPRRALTPYSLSTRWPSESLGFDHPEIDREDSLSLLSGMKAANHLILLGGQRDFPISYDIEMLSAELQMASGKQRALPTFTAVMEDYSLMGWLSEKPPLGGKKPSLWQMMQSTWMDLEQGNRIVVRMAVTPTRSGDVAGAMNYLYKARSIEGRTVPGTSIEAFDRKGQPLNQVRATSHDGYWRLRLPESAEDVTLVATAPWGAQSEQTLEPEEESAAFEFRGAARVTLPRGERMQLHFFDAADEPAMVLGNDGLNFQIGGQFIHSSLRSNRLSLTGKEHDPAEVWIPAGAYRVIASRGPEYRLTEARLMLPTHSSVQLDIEAPRRAIKRGPWLTADLHVHTGYSFDSALPADEQIKAFAASGADLLFATEHNRIVDYSDRIEKLGLQESVQLVVGSEISGMARSEQAPFTIGHSNMFPLTVDNSLYAGGLPRVEGRRLRELIGEMKERWPGALLQLNHPRSPDPADADLAFFTHLSQGGALDWALPLNDSNNAPLLEVDPVSGLRDIDFDAIEVLNGSDFVTYEETRDDWLSLLRHGFRHTATASSDSHDLQNAVGLPRSYIYWNEPGQLPVDPAAVAQRIAAGAVVASSGPMVSVNLEGALPGETFIGEEGILRVQISAADWVGADRLRIYRKDGLWREMAVAPRTQLSIPMQFENDDFVVVEVLAPSGLQYQMLYPDMEPVALSNPVFVQASMVDKPVEVIADADANTEKDAESAQP